MAKVFKIIGELVSVEVPPEEDKPEEPYVFKAWDVVESYGKHLRLIVENKDGSLRSVSPGGITQSVSQQQFEQNGYKYIGELKDYLKE